MRLRATALAVLGLVLVVGARAAEAQAKRRVVPFEISIFPPLNLWHFERKVVVGVSANVFYGRAAAVYGVEVGGLVNREREGFGGIQLAGAVNRVGYAAGIQVAGLANWATGNCFAFQVSLVNMCGRGHAIQVGLFNGGSEHLSAIQLAALANITDSSGLSIQVSPIINNAVKGFSGIQISLANLDGSTIPVRTGSCGYNCDVMQSTVYPDAEMRGLSIGLVNRAQRLRGIQIAALVNGARDVKGAQVGAFNFSGDVSGLQIGVINVARRLRGLQLGGINIAYKNPLPVFVGLNAGF